MSSSSPDDGDGNPSKRPSPEASSPCKRPKPAATEGLIPDAEEEDNDNDDVLLSWLTLDEQDVAQLMDFLSPSPPPSAPSAPREEDDAPSSPLSKVRFADNPRDDARLDVIRSSSAFITIDVNEESCGSSFSELESSVMASFDRRGDSLGGGAWVATASEMAFWCAWTGVSSGGEAVVVSGGTHCGVDDAPEPPWDGEGGLGF